MFRKTRHKTISRIIEDNLDYLVRFAYYQLLVGNVAASFPAWRGDIRFGAEISDIHCRDRYSVQLP